MNIYDLISRAQQLREETKLDSVSPDRVGALCEDTLKYINEFQLLASAPSLHKIYASVSAMQLDGAPKSDLTGKALKAGQLVVIVPESQTDATAGDVYRYDGPSGNTSAWTFVAKIGGVPADAELNASSTNPVQNKAVTEKLAELSAEIDKLPKGEEFDKQGNYPDLSAGFAENLVGRGESTPAEFTFRPSGGKSIKDGSARIKRLKGNSVVWNQGFPNEEWEVQDGSLTKEGDTYVVTSNGEYPGIFTYGMNRVTPSPTHKVLVEFDFYTDGNDGFAGVNLCGNHLAANDLQLNTWQHVALLATCDRENPYDGAVIFGSASASVLKIKNMRFHNLTKMFGAGNEPTTIEEFNARKPIVADEYAYNEGEVIHMTAEGIKSVGDNAWDASRAIKGTVSDDNGEFLPVSASTYYSCLIKCIAGAQYYFQDALNGYYKATAYYYGESMNYLGHRYVSTGAGFNSSGIIDTPENAHYMRVLCHEDYLDSCMVTLYHSGWKQDTDAKYQPYWEDRLMFDKRIKDEFSDGMSRWDMVYNKNVKGYVSKGMRVVDLGSLNWYDETFNGVPTFATKDITNGVRHHYDVMSGALNALYSEKSQFGYLANSDDKVFVFNSEAHAPNTLAVRDAAYANASEFKAAMNGVMFYYQLAEPTIIEYDEPFNLDYKVADFGTEEIIAEQPSAALAADIIYQFNAVDMIREHELEITELQRTIATMQAQLASMASVNDL